jgi:hypothetical protein
MSSSSGNNRLSLNKSGREMPILRDLLSKGHVPADQGHMQKDLPKAAPSMLRGLMQKDLLKDLQKDPLKDLQKAALKDLQKDALKVLQKDLQKVKAGPSMLRAPMQKDLQKDLQKTLPKAGPSTIRGLMQKDVPKAGPSMLRGLMQKDLQKDLQKALPKAGPSRARGLMQKDLPKAGMAAVAAGDLHNKTLPPAPCTVSDASELKRAPSNKGRKGRENAAPYKVSRNTFFNLRNALILFDCINVVG